MAKAQPFMTVQIQVSKANVSYAAQCLADILFDDFSREAIEAVGLDRETVEAELMTYEPFLQMVRDGVAGNGAEALESPYDYMDFDNVYGTRMWVSMYDACDLMQSIIDDIYRDESRDQSCNEAIETLKRAGFKIVKA